MLYLYTGGQFIWPGVRLGHKTHVPVPIIKEDGSEGEKARPITPSAASAARAPLAPPRHAATSG